MILHHVLVLAYVVIPSSILAASCPQGCVCANTLIVCTCSLETRTTNGSIVKSDDWFSNPPDFVLGSFQGIEFVSKIYIHTCRNLLILGDTFSGLNIAHELTIMNIEKLTIDSYAFRHMKKYPDHFTIKDSRVDSLKSHAFSGFNKAAHIWFKNVTIGAIETSAFSNMADIEYVYFRESTLLHVHDYAFAGMVNVENFFMRGKMRLNRVSNYLFQNSTVSNIVLEDLVGEQFGQSMFQGFKFLGTAVLTNCTIDFTDHYPRPDPYNNGQTFSAQKLEFLQSTLLNFPVGSICSNIVDVEFDQCHLQLSVTPIPLKNVTKLEIKRSHFESLQSNTFHDSNHVDSILFIDSSIDSLDANVFASSSINNVKFTKCNIKSLSRKCLSNMVLNRLIFDTCQIGRIESKILFHSRIGQLVITGSKVDLIEQEGFGESAVENVALEYSQYRRIGPRIFHRIHLRSMNLTENSIEAISDDFLADVFAIDRLTIEGNKFICTCSSFFHELFEGPKISIRNNGRTKVGRNFCYDDTAARSSSLNLKLYHKNRCLNNQHANGKASQSDKIINKSIICSKILTWTLCTCTVDSVAFSSFSLSEINRQMNSRKGSSTGLIISDCNHINFLSASLANLPQMFSHLIIERSTFDFEMDAFCEQQNIIDDSITTNKNQNIAATILSSLSIINCNVPKKFTIRSLSALKLDQFVIEESVLDGFEAHSFYNSHIGEFIIVNSKIKQFDRDTTSRASFRNISIDNCTINKFETGSFSNGQIDSVNIVHSNIAEIQHNTIDVQKQARSMFLCFAWNKLMCQCDNGGVEQFMQINGCPENENVCHSDAGYRHMTEFKSIQFLEHKDFPPECEWGFEAVAALNEVKVLQQLKRSYNDETNGYRQDTKILYSFLLVYLSVLFSIIFR